MVNCNWRLIKFLIMYMPVAVAVVAFVFYVIPLKAGWKTKIVWTAFLVFSGCKFFAFDRIGGNMFNPTMSEPLAFCWCFACDMATYIAILSVVWWFRWHRGIIIALAAAFFAGWGLWNGFCVPQVVTWNLEFENLPFELEGYRIVHISDFHTCRGITNWRTERTVDLANSLDPNLICLTGDFVDGLVKTTPDDLNPFKRLRAKDGIWAVTGNHEYYNDFPKWKDAFREHGIRILANECVFPRDCLALGGVNDLVCTYKKYNMPSNEFPDVGKTFASAKPGQFRILMQHHPHPAEFNAAVEGVRLQLSGHTHGGVMPIMSRQVAKKNGGFVKGLYPLKGNAGNSFLYVTAGAGVWGGLPARIFNPSEIALITLHRK